MRKGIIPIQFIFGLMFLLAVSYFAGKYLIPGLIPASIGSGEQKIDNCVFLRPEFGRIECETIGADNSLVKETNIPKEHNRLAPSTGYTTYLKCGDNENSPNCELWVKSDWGFTDGNVIVHYSVNGGADQIVDISMRAGKNQYFLLLDKSQYKFGTTVGLAITKLGSLKYPYTGVAKEVSTPYGLNVYDSGMKFRYNVKNCNIDSLLGAQADICIKSDGSNCAKTIGQSTILPFDDWVNYLSDYTPVPLDISNKIVTYNGQKSYCQINTIYSLGEFSTKSGCYKFPKTKIATVDCCPGMQTANAICDDNFKWQPIIIGECDDKRKCQTGYSCQTNRCVKDITCRSDLECAGQGNWIPDYSSAQTKANRWGCSDGDCKIVETKSTQCLPPYTGCPDGQICDPNKGYVCVTQEGPDVKCGDSVCSTPFESKYTCPGDCDRGGGGVGRKIATFIVALIASAIIVFMLRFIPFPLFRLTVNPQIYVIAVIIVAIILYVVFNIPMTLLAGSLFGGV